MAKKIIIIDLGDISSSNKSGFFSEEEASKISHTLLPLCHLRDASINNGYDFITSSFYLENKEKYSDCKKFLISHLVSGDTSQIINSGVIPLILFCQESPFIATRFYTNIKKISSLFKYSILFLGMKKRVSLKTNFLQMFFPQTPRKDIAEISYKEKKFCTFISSNKKLTKKWKILPIKLLFGLGIKNIYNKRFEIVKHFSKKRNFDLFGRGWNNELDADIIHSYKGEVEDKTKKLSEYKFVFCLENSMFKGYITEKIFDCFWAKSVPIYLGAPDITKYIPENTFIDLRNFSTYDELNNYLNSMNEKTYSEHLCNISNFLKSEDYMNFDESIFINKILDILKKENEKN